jgi:hypothetical protein
MKQDYKVFLCTILIGIIFISIVIYYNRKSYAPEYDLLNKLSSVDFSEFKRRAKRDLYKREKRCRSIVEALYNKSFPSIRPDFLKNPKTGKNLELDMYNAELKIAFEVDGPQHADYHPYFHKTREDFVRQIERDTLKDRLCRQNNIKLRRIPHTVKEKDLEKYIQDLIQK